MSVLREIGFYRKRDTNFTDCQSFWWWSCAFWWKAPYLYYVYIHHFQSSKGHSKSIFSSKIIENLQKKKTIFTQPTKNTMFVGFVITVGKTIRNIHDEIEGE